MNRAFIIVLMCCIILQATFASIAMSTTSNIYGTALSNQDKDPIQKTIANDKTHQWELKIITHGCILIGALIIFASAFDLFKPQDTSYKRNSSLLSREIITGSFLGVGIATLGIGFYEQEKLKKQCPSSGIPEKISELEKLLINTQTHGNTT